MSNQDYYKGDQGFQHQQQGGYGPPQQGGYYRKTPEPMLLSQPDSLTAVCSDVMH